MSEKTWLVWVDDTPVMPEAPMRLEEALADLDHQAEDENNLVVEIRQCRVSRSAMCRVGRKPGLAPASPLDLSEPWPLR